MRTVRVIILNADEEVAPELRAVLLSVDGVKIVAELDEPALLPQALDQFPAEILLVHLDPNPAAMMDVVAPLIEARKDRLATIGMTEDRDAELVVRAMRAGMREFLWKPFPPEQLGDILRRIAETFDGNSTRLGRLLSVVGTAGGQGVTTLATNVAVELAQLEGWSGAPNPVTRPRVAIVDLDFRFGQVAMHLDAAPTYTIAELCETPEQIDRAMIERAMFKHPSGVHVLARPNDFATANRITAGQAAGALAALQEHYDFVVADLPARFDPSAQAVFDMADTYLLVLQLLVPSVRNAARILEELSRIGYCDGRVRLVCGRYGREAGYLEPDDVEQTLGRKIEFLVPDDWKTAAMAVNMGAPLLTHAPKSKLRAAYQKLAGTLAAADDEPAELQEAGEGGRRGLFALFGGN